MAFTLLELLVVIAIIAVVAGLTFPVAQSSRQKGNQMSCLSNLQSIGLIFSIAIFIIMAFRLD